MNNLQINHLVAAALTDEKILYSQENHQQVDCDEASRWLKC